MKERKDDIHVSKQAVFAACSMGIVIGTCIYFPGLRNFETLSIPVIGAIVGGVAEEVRIYIEKELIKNTRP